MDTNKLFSRINYMEDGTISLHSIEDKDGEQLYRIFSNSEIFNYCGFSTIQNKDIVPKIILSIKTDFEKQESVNWGIFIKEQDLLIGKIEVLNFNIKANCAEMGYFIHPDYWNKGYTKRAVKLLLSYLFNEIEINRIEAEVLPANIYPKKVLISNGFTKEGTIRQGTFWEKFGIIDIEKYSILKQEYKG